MMAFLLLCVGLAGLWWGTELAVRAAIRIADARGLSQAFVGMTILAIGTDVPELVMSIVAGIERLQGIETSGIVVGSAVGSCLGQIGLVLGIAGLTGYLTLKRSRIWTDGVMLLGSIVLFGLVLFDGEIDRVEGGLLITIYVIYFLLLIRREQRSETRAKARSIPWREGLQCALGLTLVAGFSHLVLSSALTLADSWGLKQTVVGIALIGVGTSLPELALSISAVRKKAGGLSVGNILGSNIFDMLVPPGFAALIAELSIDAAQVLALDLPVLFLISLLALIFFTKKRGLQKIEAASLLLAYLVYAVLRVAW